MKRKIIQIDENLCNGCGLCEAKCAESALKIVDGKARLVSDIYCDGLGACIGECPRGAITIEEREARPFDENAVHERLATENNTCGHSPQTFSCPGSAVHTFERTKTAPGLRNDEIASKLSTWPVQISLVPVHAPFLKGADLLICADCVPFALPDFHERFLSGRVVLVGCPKLDDILYYREKLRDIFLTAKPSSITVLRMEVPCCGGMARAVVEARDNTAPDLPVEIHTVGIGGSITHDTVPSILI